MQEKDTGNSNEVVKDLKAGPGEISTNEIFRFVGTYWLYQDKIGWSRIQTLLTVEAAVLAGAFARKGPLAPVILFVGTMVIYYLYQLRATIGDAHAIMRFTLSPWGC